RVVANAEAVRDHFAAQGLPADKIAVVPNLVDVEERDRLAAVPFPRAGELPAGRRLVVVNRLDPEKNVGVLIDALPRDRFRVIPSMRFAHFSELMKNAKCMVGNSSAGVREAPFLGLPSLDVGTRQTNRADAPSIRAVDAGDAAGISDFLKTEWGRSHPRHTGFGEGRAADRFVQVLRDPAFWSRSLQKEFRDIG
ncbi:UDP-N-acetylglucosamine 2-epimerase (hydrolyzing), partial [Candidatus Falkowbacteria bacterium]|nr:UDP-N-acetylglucosamine 2-epimerase (hydrolyzing) [Candidatus Falkowbacteria bacterium]